MPAKTKLQSVLILAASVMLAACGPPANPTHASAPLVSGVKLQTVRMAAASQTVEAVGTIRSVNTSVLSAQIGGTVRQVLVKAGDHVRQGQLLATLDDRTPSAQLGAAQAGVEEANQGVAEINHGIEAATASRRFAEATYKRYQALLAKKSISQQEFDNAESNYHAALANEQSMLAKRKEIEARGKQAEAMRSSAETMLSFARVVAPSGGVVTAKQVDAGTVVMPGTPLFTVEDHSRYRLEASIPEEFASQAKLGEAVPVTTIHGQLQGKIAEVVPAADPGSRTFLVKIDLPAPCGCQSGEYGKAALPVASRQLLMAPHSALVEHGELEGVFVADPQGIVEYRLVKTGKVMGDEVEILSGLSDGERVAANPTGQLRDGVRVEVQ